MTKKNKQMNIYIFIALQYSGFTNYGLYIKTPTPTCLACQYEEKYFLKKIYNI